MNLHRTAARVVVVKKNKSVLTKLVKDLKQIHGLLGELPVLIIDDESDQASVNTLQPEEVGARPAQRPDSHQLPGLPAPDAPSARPVRRLHSDSLRQRLR